MYHNVLLDYKPVFILTFIFLDAPYAFVSGKTDKASVNGYYKPMQSTALQNSTWLLESAGSPNTYLSRAHDGKWVISQDLERTTIIAQSEAVSISPFKLRWMVKKDADFVYDETFQVLMSNRQPGTIRSIFSIWLYLKIRN